jgi:hypothetical protein
MNWRNLLLLLLFAFFALGGTFTCTTNDGDKVIHTTNTNDKK